MSELVSIFPARLEWPPSAADDVAELPADSSHVRLRAGAKNFHLLAQLPQLKRLWCFDIDDESLAVIAQCKGLEALYIEHLKVASVAALKDLPKLSILSIEGCSKMRDLSFITQLRHLKGLAIIDCKNVHNLTPLSQLTNLEALAVAGGTYTRMRVNSFAPLAHLHNLEFLHLTNIKADDDSLAPFRGLRKLRQLDSTNYYPMAEYARLSRELPFTRCIWFEPYIEFSHSRCTRCNQPSMVILTGIRKPKLCKHCDSRRLVKHVAEWNAARSELRRRVES